MIVSAGDNFYEDGVADVNDTQWHDTYEDVFVGASVKDIPWYSVLGNHDYHRSPDAQIAYRSDRWNMPDFWFSFEKPITNCPQVYYESLCL